METPRRSLSRRVDGDGSISTKHVPQSGKMIPSTQLLEPTRNQSITYMGPAESLTSTQIHSSHEISNILEYAGEFEDVKRIFMEQAKMR